MGMQFIVYLGEPRDYPVIDGVAIPDASHDLGAVPATRRRTRLACSEHIKDLEI